MHSKACRRSVFREGEIAVTALGLAVNGKTFIGNHNMIKLLEVTATRDSLCQQNTIQREGCKIEIISRSRCIGAEQAEAVKGIVLLEDVSQIYVTVDLEIIPPKKLACIVIPKKTVFVDVIVFFTAVQKPPFVSSLTVVTTGRGISTEQSCSPL